MGYPDPPLAELPGDEYYDLVAAWVFHTYLLEPVQYSPIICLFAVPERGKSRTGKGMINVAYRGVHVESLIDASLVRVANNLNASIFFNQYENMQFIEEDPIPYSGGIGNIPGAMLGGIFLGLIESVGPSLFLDGLGIVAPYQLKDAIAFTMLVMVLIFRPTGILGERLAVKKA